MDMYIDILREWERSTALPAVYEHIDVLFPEYGFRRVQAGSQKDHWASRYKIDGTLPKKHNSEKTVIYRTDMKFREQGDWNNAVSIQDVIIRKEGLANIYEFDRYVAARFGLDMPQPDSKAVQAAVNKQRLRTDILADLLDYFVWNLTYNESPKAGKVRNYLKTKRKFSAEGVEYFQFGFVPAWEKVISYMTLKKGYSKEDLDAACQVYNDEGKTLVGKTHTLAIPYECGGILKGFIFRRVDSNEQPKYIANTGLDRKSAFFFIKQEVESIVVVEGEMDALTARAAGIEDPVAIGGSEVTGERRKQLEDAFRRGAKRITLCFDLDTKKDAPDVPNFAARHEHLMKTIHTIKDIDPSFEEIYIACFDRPCDPDEYIHSEGAEAFCKLIAEAEPWWKYAYGYYETFNTHGKE